MLLVIAVIAVCLGVWQAQPVLGVIVAVIVLPALGYTSVIAFQSASKGRPMAVSEKLNRFLAALVGVVVILFAALVAFCMTCVPTGFIAMSAAGDQALIVALVVGGIFAAAAAAGVTYLLLRRRNRAAGTTGKP
jgi:hypothetical protein